MLLTVTTTHRPATDLGYLLVKHPDRVHTFALPTGTAHVVYPEATHQRCTAALLLDVDPVKLSRRLRSGPDTADGGAYVNDRPYAASSLLAAALVRVFGSALHGSSKDRPELAATPIPLEIAVPALPCRGGGAALVHRLFAPLGWQVEAAPVPLDPAFPDWGASRYAGLTLRGTVRVADALNHLYVLLPVLDDAKHYWVAPDEVDKLLRAGEGWLATHPERSLITRRYLAHRRSLTVTALARLEAAADTGAATDEDTELPPAAKRVPLAAERRTAVRAALAEAGAAAVLDLGCGSGALLAELVAEPRYTRVVGADVSAGALAAAGRRLRLDRLPERQRQRIALWQTALTYRDDRLRGFDAAVLMEVIEHVDLPRLPALCDAVFGHARPATVIVTTPNVEYNVRYEGMAAGKLRHSDHRFEWTRAELAGWAERVASGFGYRVQVRGVGEGDAEVGAPTQLALFTREGAA